MIVQGIFGLIAGGLVVVKVYWRKIRLLFSPSAKTGRDRDDPARREPD